MNDGKKCAMPFFKVIQCRSSLKNKQKKRKCIKKNQYTHSSISFTSLIIFVDGLYGHIFEQKEKYFGNKLSKNNKVYK